MAAVAPAAPAVRPASGEPVNLWGLAGAFVALVVVMALPTPQALPYAGQIMLGLLLFSVILWMTEAVDYAISAALIVALMAFLLGMAPSAARLPALITGAGVQFLSNRSSTFRAPAGRWTRQAWLFLFAESITLG